MNVRFDVLELFANQESLELNLAIITGFMAELRFMAKYKMTRVPFDCVPAIWAGITAVIPIEI